MGPNGSTDPTDSMNPMTKNPFFRFITCLVLFAFISTTILPTPNFAQSVLNLPIPGAMVMLTPAYVPTVIRGLKVHPDNPFRFDFIVDTGDSKLNGPALKKESEKLIKYFLASLAVPENDLWVNLSPYEQDRIIPEKFGTTEMGRDLLAQDYLLKQLTASLMYPEERLGQQFWGKVFKKANDLYGTTNIPINTFNKVWIIPEKAVVYETNDTAYVTESHLKVMLEEDYLAINKNLNQKDIGTDQLAEKDVKQLSNVSSQIVKEIILPAIEQEINEGKNFSQLRQVYHSLVLAVWFKKRLKESLLAKVYVGKNKIKGVDVADKEIRQKIYEQYVKAFETGVYDYIKEDYDQDTRQRTAKRYFAGGMQFDPTALDKAIEYNLLDTPDEAAIVEGTGKHLFQIAALGSPRKIRGNADAANKNLKENMRRANPDTARVENPFPFLEPGTVISIDDLQRITSSKHVQRVILEGGPIAQTPFFVAIERDTEMLQEVRNLDPLLFFDFSYDTRFTHPDRVKTFDSIVGDVLSDKIALPFMFKPNSLHVAQKLFKMEKSPKTPSKYIFTFAYGTVEGSGGMPYWVDYGDQSKKLMEKLVIFPSIEFHPDEGKGILQIIVDGKEVDLKEVLKAIRTVTSQYSIGPQYVYDSGTAESFVPGPAYNPKGETEGLNYEMRIGFNGTLSGDFQINETHSIGRLGNLAPNQEELPFDKMFEPFYEMFNISSADHQKVKEYIWELARQQFQYFISRLRAGGIVFDVPVHGTVDLKPIGVDYQGNPQLLFIEIHIEYRCDPRMRIPVIQGFRSEYRFQDTISLTPKGAAILIQVPKKVKEDIVITGKVEKLPSRGSAMLLLTNGRILNINPAEEILVDDGRQGQWKDQPANHGTQDIINFLSTKDLSFPVTFKWQEEYSTFDHEIGRVVETPEAKNNSTLTYQTPNGETRRLTREEAERNGIKVYWVDGAMIGTGQEDKAAISTDEPAFDSPKEVVDDADAVAMEKGSKPDNAIIKTGQKDESALSESDVQENISTSISTFPFVEDVVTKMRAGDVLSEDDAMKMGFQTVRQLWEWMNGLAEEKILEGIAAFRINRKTQHGQAFVYIDKLVSFVLKTLHNLQYVSRSRGLESILLAQKALGGVVPPFLITRKLKDSPFIAEIIDKKNMRAEGLNRTDTLDEELEALRGAFSVIVRKEKAFGDLSKEEVARLGGTKLVDHYFDFLEMLWRERRLLVYFPYLRDLLIDEDGRILLLDFSTVIDSKTAENFYFGNLIKSWREEVREEFRTIDESLVAYFDEQLEKRYSIKPDRNIPYRELTERIKEIILRDCPLDIQDHYVFPFVGGEVDPYLIQQLEERYQIVNSEAAQLNKTDQPGTGASVTSDVAMIGTGHEDKAAISTGDDRKRTANKQGGIDLTPANLDLQIQGEGVNFLPQFDPAQIEQMNIEGLSPLILKIIPMTNVPVFMGVGLTENKPAGEAKDKSKTPEDSFTPEV